MEESVGKAVGATVASGPGDSARSGFTGTAASLAEVLDSSESAKLGIDWVGIDWVGIAAGPQDKTSRKTTAQVHVFMNLGSAQNVASVKLHYSRESCIKSNGPLKSISSRVFTQ